MISSPVQTLLALIATLGLAPSAEPANKPAKQTSVVSNSSAVSNSSTGDSTGAASALPATQSAGSDTTDASRPRPVSARVLFITTNDCPRCEFELARLRKPGGDFEKMRARGWKVGAGADDHLQIVDRSAVADLVEQLKVRQFPTVAAVSDGQIVRSFQAGCTTPLDVWTFGFLAKGIDERPPGSVPEAARVETTGNYPLRGNHWSIDEDWNPPREKVVNHLRGPVHGGQTAKYSNLESWSYEELRSLHDNLHEIEMGGVSYAGRSAPANDPFSAGRKTLSH
jgi:hypothetical protein